MKYTVDDEVLGLTKGEWKMVLCIIIAITFAFLLNK